MTFSRFFLSFFLVGIYAQPLPRPGTRRTDATLDEKKRVHYNERREQNPATTDSDGDVCVDDSESKRGAWLDGSKPQSRGNVLRRIGGEEVGGIL